MRTGRGRPGLLERPGEVRRIELNPVASCSPWKPSELVGPNKGDTSMRNTPCSKLWKTENGGATSIRRWEHAATWMMSRPEQPAGLHRDELAGARPWPCPPPGSAPCSSTSANSAAPPASYKSPRGRRQAQTCPLEREARPGGAGWLAPRQPPPCRAGPGIGLLHLCGARSGVAAWPTARRPRAGSICSKTRTRGSSAALARETRLRPGAERGLEPSSSSSAAQTCESVRRSAAGTLLGGRGLPKAPVEPRDGVEPVMVARGDARREPPRPPRPDSDSQAWVARCLAEAAVSLPHRASSRDAQGRRDLHRVACLDAEGLDTVRRSRCPDEDGGVITEKSATAQ